MNTLNKIFEILLAVVLLFICPLQYFTERQEIVMGQKVIAETSYFIDSIRNTGKLTKQMYETFTKQLSITGNIYEIELLHYHTVYYDESEEKSDDDRVYEEFLGNKSYYLYTLKDIIEILYEESMDSDSLDLKQINSVTGEMGTTKGGVYTFTQGDYIRISLTQKNRSFAERIQSCLYLTPMTDNNRVIYGGLIRNETY